MEQCRVCRFALQRGWQGRARREVRLRARFGRVVKGGVLFCRSVPPHSRGRAVCAAARRRRERSRQVAGRTGRCGRGGGAAGERDKVV